MFGRPYQPPTGPTRSLWPVVGEQLWADDWTRESPDAVFTYVLHDGKDVHTLSDQRTPEQFAAQKVRVIGTLDTKTRRIQVDSMSTAS